MCNHSSMKNIFYFRYINQIGGIETFFYQLAMAYKDWDITIYYSRGDKAQIARLSQYVRVVKYTGQNIVCDKAFFNFNTDIIDHVEAKEYGLILHGDYKSMVEQRQLSRDKLPLHPKITKYYGVSQLVCDSFEELTGIKPQLIYNPFKAPEPKKILRLISCTRLTKEKGLARMEALAKALNTAGIPFIWTIFTDSEHNFKSPNICKLPPRIDIAGYIADSDYLVQLSDNEGYCYSIIEALSLGVPVITTPLPVLKELGVDESNSITLPFDMNNLPIDQIAEHDFDFTYTPKPSNWGEILAKGKSTYSPMKEGLIFVEANDNYHRHNLVDQDLGYRPEVGEIFAVSESRLKVLAGDNVYGTPFIRSVRL